MKSFRIALGAFYWRRRCRPWRRRCRPAQNWRRAGDRAPYQRRARLPDPIKAVGLPEIQVIRDLFEGLTNQDAQGKVVPGVAQSWQSYDNQSWILRCAGCALV